MVKREVDDFKERRHTGRKTPFLPRMFAHKIRVFFFSSTLVVRKDSRGHFLDPSVSRSGSGAWVRTHPNRDLLWFPDSGSHSQSYDLFVSVT